MLPAVSAEDCLFADLGVDPACDGCQSYEASDFIIRRRVIDTSAALVLWQVGVVGIDTYGREQPKIGVLVDVLSNWYAKEHHVTVYEASSYPGSAPHIEPTPLGGLTAATIPEMATLFVPPSRHAVTDEAMVSRLGLQRRSRSAPA